MRNYFDAQQMDDILSDPKNLIPPRKLFGPYWYENEICFLIADSNAGKSILASDITIAIDCGYNYWNQVMCEVPGEKNNVLYDLEQSKRQFTARYAGKDFCMNNITRVEFDHRNTELFTWQDLLNDIEDRINSNMPNVVILDNLSCVLPNATNAKEAIEFMRSLKAIKEMNGNVSFLILAHTHKRNMGKPIDQNNLIGSKFLMNFADSAFAIGFSVKDESTRYIKQIKTRSSEKLGQVAEMEIEGSPYLHMEFVDWGTEDDHLHSMPRRSRIDDFIGELIIELYQDGYSIREIASRIGVSKSSIHRFIKANTNEEEIE